MSAPGLSQNALKRRSAASASLRAGRGIIVAFITQATEYTTLATCDALVREASQLAAAAKELLAAVRELENRS